jgi:hypothetical protein
MMMSGIKDKLKGVKDKVTGAGEDAKDTVTGTGSGAYEEGAPGTERGRKDDPLTSYRDKEPMTPAKIKEHEPTAVKREMSERITEPGQTGTSPEEAAEIARAWLKVLLEQRKQVVNTNKELPDRISRIHRNPLRRYPAIFYSFILEQGKSIAIL